MALVLLVMVNVTYCPAASSWTASRPTASLAREPWAKPGLSSEPSVVPFTAWYSVNGTSAPTPLGTLNTDPAQYGGVPAPLWAYAGAAANSAGRVASAVTAASARAAKRPGRRGALDGRPADLSWMDIRHRPFPRSTSLPYPVRMSLRQPSRRQGGGERRCGRGHGVPDPRTAGARVRHCGGA